MIDHTPQCMWHRSPLFCTCGAEAENRIAALEAENAKLREALEVIRNMKKVTATLGKGIGHIAVDADFFALWNETEIAASRILKAARALPEGE